MKMRPPICFKGSEADWNALTFAQQHAVVAEHQPKSKLLRSKKDSQFLQDVVSVDVFCHDVQVLADVRDALDAGLHPKAFELVEQEDGYAVVLRLEREES